MHESIPRHKEMMPLDIDHGAPCPAARWDGRSCIVHHLTQRKMATGFMAKPPKSMGSSMGESGNTVDVRHGHEYLRLTVTINWQRIGALLNGVLTVQTKGGQDCVNPDVVEPDCAGTWGLKSTYLESYKMDWFFKWYHSMTCTQHTTMTWTNQGIAWC